MWCGLIGCVERRRCRVACNRLRLCTVCTKYCCMKWSHVCAYVCVCAHVCRCVCAGDVGVCVDASSGSVVLMCPKVCIGHDTGEHQESLHRLRRLCGDQTYDGAFAVTGGVVCGVERCGAVSCGGVKPFVTLAYFGAHMCVCACECVWCVVRRRVQEKVVCCAATLSGALNGTMEREWLSVSRHRLPTYFVCTTGNTFSM